MNNKKKLDFQEIVSNAEYKLISGNIHFDLKEGMKYSFNFMTNNEEKFSAEVIFYVVE